MLFMAFRALNMAVKLLLFFSFFRAALDQSGAFEALELKKKRHPSWGRLFLRDCAPRSGGQRRALLHASLNTGRQVYILLPIISGLLNIKIKSISFLKIAECLRNFQEMFTLLAYPCVDCRKKSAFKQISIKFETYNVE